jgi:CubicO group peptidase (beta-lactamase class C family)
MASGSKGFTALAIMSLIDDGKLELATTARSILGTDLPLIDDAVTVEHLLGHRSGIGDYLDEGADYAITDYMVGAAHELDSAETFLKLLDGHPTKFAPGEQFAYCNGGFVVLAVIAERVSGAQFQHLIQDRVLVPAGMLESGFLRSDELPGRTALGYFETDGLKTNVFHLPVFGSGDGGAYTTLEDMHRFWPSLFEGKIIPVDRVAEMVKPRSELPGEQDRYGLGFWLGHHTDTVMLEGYDAGVSFWSAHDPGGAFTCTVLSNTTEGAWPIARVLRDQLLAT